MNQKPNATPNALKGRILVVDNDERIVTAITARLSSEGYECLPATSARQGLALYERGDVDLVITDLNMPECDGIALSERLREISGVPILQITAYPTVYEGCNAHIRDTCVVSKPFEWDALLDLVAVKIAQYRAKERRPVDPFFRAQSS
jgi:DNA-binding response OmpR family regulator